MRDHDAGTLRTEKISVDSILERLYYPDMPDPDLLIRTSGEQRISNFLLWEAAYAELWFTPVFWPTSTVSTCEAIRDFQKRSRRFGNVDDDCHSSVAGGNRRTRRAADAASSRRLTR